MYDLIDYIYYNHHTQCSISSILPFCIRGFMALFGHNDKICEIVNPDPKLTEFLDPMTIMCAPLIHLCTVPVHQDGCCTFGHFICWSILTQPQYMARRDQWLSVQIPRPQTFEIRRKIFGNTRKWGNLGLNRGHESI